MDAIYSNKVSSLDQSEVHLINCCVENIDTESCFNSYMQDVHDCLSVHWVQFLINIGSTGDEQDASL